MDINLKYKAWVGEKHADIASPLTNSDIEVYATEFAEWVVKNLDIQRVSQQSKLLFEFNEWVANDRRSTTVKQLVDGFIKEKFK